MSESLARILVDARRQNKFVLVKTLVPYGLHLENFRALEDEGIVHVWHTKQEGFAVNLTLKGYKMYAHLAS
ncbi:hypothetical protein [Alicyclobacillus shizuokensis]|uniref:hypothetical protein n=1 Tax=Alicyclobacillus shizuokensis TaxID=392014 RepID=UPI000829D62E|nr:hypothetical protein [Alicyclobacillus shizuokensis]